MAVAPGTAGAASASRQQAVLANVNRQYAPGVVTLSDRTRHRDGPVGFLIYMSLKVTFKMVWWALVVELWLGWAMVALTVALIASLTGHDGTARQWMRSLNWRRVL